MVSRRPGVTIGVPVYNGGTLLEEALRAIGSQTYQDLEVIVGDNASTDATADIVADVARLDPRVRYFRNEHNVGAPDNFNRTFLASTRTYFKWASHDDLLAPTFIERCVAELERDPEAVLAFSRIAAVGEDGEVRKQLPTQLPATASDDPVRRFEAVSVERHGGFPLWGVVRADVLADTRLHQRFPGGDKVLLAELALRGRFCEVDETLFFLRAHEGRSVTSMPSIYLRAAWHAPGSNPRFLMPHWRMARGYLDAVERAPLRRGRRQLARRAMVIWVFRNWNWARLMSDGIVLVIPSAWRIFETARGFLRRRHRKRPPARSPIA